MGVYIELNGGKTDKVLINLNQVKSIIRTESNKIIITFGEGQTENIVLPYDNAEKCQVAYEKIRSLVLEESLCTP